MFLYEYWNRARNGMIGLKSEEKLYKAMAFGVLGTLVSTALLLMIHYGFDRNGHWVYDSSGINFVNNVRNFNLSRIMLLITSSGNYYSIIIITLIEVILLWRIACRRVGLFLGINILGIWLFNELLKSIFKRSRPVGKWLVHASGFSLPSGHSMIFMGLSLITIYFLIIYLRRRWLAVGISIFAFTYGLLVGLSRVYVGVHYISDVFSGWSVALLWTSLSIIIFTLMEFRIKVKKKLE